MIIYEILNKIGKDFITHNDKESSGLSFRLFLDKFLIVEGQNDNLWIPSISCEAVSLQYAQSELDKSSYTDVETGIEEILTI